MPSQALPSPWVDRIFSKLTLTYGHRFLGLYAGLDMEAVKADWAHELGAYTSRPEAIAHAMAVLPPDSPPNVMQFRDLCRRAPEYAPKALPAPPPDPTLAQELRRAVRPVLGSGGRQWAHSLQARIAAGYRPTPFQRQAVAEALGNPEPVEAEDS